jgi:hypothetical protein
MFQINTAFIEINGTLYKIVKRIRESHSPILDAWKEHLGADKVFKKDEFYFFVKEVPEAEIVQDETQTQ